MLLTFNLRLQGVKKQVKDILALTMFFSNGLPKNNSTEWQIMQKDSETFILLAKTWEIATNSL